MIRSTSATPCPEGPQAYHYRPRDSILSLGGDDTTEVDFTTEFRASLRAIKPRRRQTAIGAKRRGVAVDFAIHEDQEVQPSHGVSLKGSVLARPPQRPKARVSFMPETKEAPEAHTSNKAEPSHSAMLLGRIRRASILPRPEADHTQALIPANPEEIIKRPARRGTVYIPNDDTTMPSMHMGIFSPIKDLQNGARGGEQDATVEFTGLAAQMAKKRGRRESFVAQPAKRVPLHHPLHIVQESTSPGAVPGKRTGKENIPPGHFDAVCEVGFEETKLFDLSRPEPSKQRRSTLNPVRPVQKGSGLQAENQVSVDQGVKAKARRKSTLQQPPVPRRDAAAQIRDIRQYQNRPSTQAIPQKGSQLPSHSLSRPLQPTIPRAGKGKVPAKLTIPEIPQIQFHQQYPLLSENVTDPSMYEESWLTHQEIAITQLVNRLFENARGSQDAGHAQNLRHDLLEIYQDPSFSLLHKRMKASMLYGALSVPKDVLARASRLWTDLGMRERFCSFWLDTYDLASLRAGLEVVIGRECSGSPRTSQNGSSSNTFIKVKASRRAVRMYLEMFMVRNEDTVPEKGVESREAWCYQRTLLRSLLLIKLLDKAKNSQANPSSPCLFLSTSSYKSSSDVVKALAQMLNPSVGDVLRLLSHLDYFVSHKQYPLEEYNYKIDKLAVDLRDGVRLTRLVELLLYPSASHMLSRARDSDGTTTVQMPTGEVLSLLEGEHDWPLSQHLKFPCIGRATKLYNVQVALSALTGVRGMESLVRDIQAEDVVDGFREKTVALLWGLSGKWGLGGLIDWDDVQRETSRLSGIRSNHLESGLDDFEEGFESHKCRLKAWAAAVAGKRGLQVNNLTTSFSDGKVFEVIVDEYEQYMHNSPEDRSDGLPLHERLASLGCSGQFGK